MTISAVAHDPYLLPVPSPAGPVVLPELITQGNQHPNSRYRDTRWSLAPLIDNPGTSLRAINWDSCPEPLRRPLKHAAWAMINGELRPTYVSRRGTRSGSRSSPGEMRLTCQEWMSLARWLYERGISELDACTAAEWSAYAQERWGGGIRRDYAEKILGRLTDLWAFGQLTSTPLRVSCPPWETEGADEYLPAAQREGGGENATEPLDPEVIGPLLIWAIRMVDDFADDILAAWDERQRLAAAASAAASTESGRAALNAYLLPMVKDGRPLPACNRGGTIHLGRVFISAVTGASRAQVGDFARQHFLSAVAAERPGPCPLETPVTGRLDGRPWREHIDFYEAAGLMRHLGTAAMIICLYLTGMRPQEVQGLRSSCCPDPGPEPDGSPGRHLIRGHHYKNVTDGDGRHISAGAEREVPWVAITPVVNAIRVLERMVPDGELLFSAAHHDFPKFSGQPGALKARGLNYRIGDFAAWASREARTRERPGEVIPEDTYGPVSLARFRRTLAWHVARRPGGLIALAIQYGHMRTVLDARTSSGYGTRSRNGLHSVLDVETALAAADTAMTLRDRLAAGEKISGPAARRAITAAAQAPRFNGRIVTGHFARKARTYLARDGIVLHDNPDALLICAFKRDTALCEPGPDSTAPRQLECRPGCGNAVRTDTHARQLRERADEIDQLAASAPGPIGDRLKNTARKLRDLADTHDETAGYGEALA